MEVAPPTPWGGSLQSTDFLIEEKALGSTDGCLLWALLPPDQDSNPDIIRPQVARAGEAARVGN